MTSWKSSFCQAAQEAVILTDKNCAYPKCTECGYADCVMENKDIAAMLKRRRYAANPTLYRRKQQGYRAGRKANLPHCDECESCVLVEKEKQDGYRRLCIDTMRLIEQKVSNCPQWYRKRDEGKEYRIALLKRLDELDAKIAALETEYRKIAAVVKAGKE